MIKHLKHLAKTVFDDTMDTVIDIQGYAVERVIGLLDRVDEQINQAVFNIVFKEDTRS